jgi:Protein of unknown function (DUF664)
MGLSRLAIAGHSLGGTFATERGSGISLHWVGVDTSEEYARHNGRAGLLRELSDGTTGL